MSNLPREGGKKEPRLEKIGWKQDGIQWQPSTLWAPGESCPSEQNSTPLIFLSPSHGPSAASHLPVFENPELSPTHSSSSFGTYLCWRGPLKMHVLPRGLECDLVWKWHLCRCSSVSMRSFWRRLRPWSNIIGVFMRDAEADAWGRQGKDTGRMLGRQRWQWRQPRKLRNSKDKRQSAEARRRQERILPGLHS